jgi:hypothetical protein
MGSGHGVDPSFLFISGASLPAVPGRANSNFGIKTLEVGIEPILMATETTQNSENTKIQRLTISLFLATPGPGKGTGMNHHWQWMFFRVLSWPFLKMVV